ncbi:hypothetical protein J3D47_001360 [Pseudomonas laurylsulfativorans]|uniref:hypothetical protein n=1 Tax=Pseudomonas laurylsulfativorans TaxID=1943631 RepID=UPI0020A02B18|nr:hypothetical protein [Pseudomonas laurylsulfativorans]MCP1417117.1 hypothetical protein [Pseudomonas laurylsulfativorans]
MDNFYRNYLAQKSHPIDDDVLNKAVESFEGVALKFSNDFLSDARQRENYNRNVRRVKAEVLNQVRSGSISVKEAAEFCYEARNKIMAEIRANTSVHGLAIAEKKKFVAPALEEILNRKTEEKFGKKFIDLSQAQKNSVYYEIVESSARPNIKFNTVNKVLKVSGKVLIVVTVAHATYVIANADNKPKETIKQGITIGGGLAGGVLASMAVSTICGPGAPFCAIGLMLAGGAASGWVASEIADSLDDELEEFTRWQIN